MGGSSRILLTGGINGRVTFWDVNTHTVARTLQFGDPVASAAVSADGQLLAVQTQVENRPDSRVEVVALATGKVLQTHVVRYGQGGVEFSRDGRELVALGCCEPASAVAAWDPRTGAQLFSRRVAAHATAIAFAPNSRVLGVVTEDGKLLLWDPRRGTESGPPIQVAAGNIGQIAFSPGGRSFAIGSFDQTASLRDLPTHRRLGNPFPLSPGTVPAVLFEPNGRLLISQIANASEWPSATSELGALRVPRRRTRPQPRGVGRPPAQPSLPSSLPPVAHPRPPVAAAGCALRRRGRRSRGLPGGNCITPAHRLRSNAKPSDHGAIVPHGCRAAAADIAGSAITVTLIRAPTPQLDSTAAQLTVAASVPTPRSPSSTRASTIRPRTACV